MQSISFKQVESEGLFKKYSVNVPKSSLQKQYEEKIAEFQQQAEMPGFRKGKFPLKLIEKRVGPSLVSEILEKSVNDATKELFEKEKNIEPVATPKIELSKETQEQQKNVKTPQEVISQDLEFFLEFEIAPEIPEIDVSSLDVPLYEVTLEDDKMQEILQTIKRTRREFIPLQSYTEATKDGDAVDINFKGFIDGEAFQGGEKNNHQIIIGEKSFIEGFEEQLIGKKQGEEFKVKVTFPSQYFNKEVAGKDAEFEVKLNNVLEVKEPEINDEFAKANGAKDLADLKANLASNVKDRAEKDIRDISKKRLFDKLEDILTFPIPKSLYEKEFNIIKEKLLEGKKEGEEGYEEKLASAEKLANRRVRTGLFLVEIAKQEKIKVEQQDIFESISKDGLTSGVAPETLLQYYQKNPQLLEGLKGEIIENKAVEFLLGKIKGEKTQISIEEKDKILAEEFKDEESGLKL